MPKQVFGSDFERKKEKTPRSLVKKKDFSTSRDYEFKDIVQKEDKSKMGRPVKFVDKRYKATNPKRISPVVNVKIEALKPYISELSDETGEISFNTVVDTLIESYLKQKLSATKEEFIRNEIEKELNKLPK